MAAQSPGQVTVGPAKFSAAGVYIGIASSLMTFPLNILIILIFRYSGRQQKLILQQPEEKEEKPDKEEDEENKNKEKTVEEILNEFDEEEKRKEKEAKADDYYIEEELRDQMEYLDTGDENKRALRKKGEVTPDDCGLVQVANIPLPKDRKEKDKSCRLPDWFVYVGYGLCFCTVAVSFWATVEFAGQFGRQKSLEWLLSFFISAFESIFFSQPIKVITV